MNMLTGILQKNKEKKLVREFTEKMDRLMQDEEELLYCLEKRVLTSAYLNMLGIKTDFIIKRVNEAENTLMSTAMINEVKEVYLIRSSEVKLRLIHLKSVITEAEGELKAAESLNDIGKIRGCISKLNANLAPQGKTWL